MKRFVFGFLLGLFLGSVALVTAHVPQGYLSNWAVTKGGRIVCLDPYIWPSSREIECE